VPPSLRLVVFLPEPPSGEPACLVHAGEVGLPITGFAVQATDLQDGRFRVEVSTELHDAQAIDTLRRIAGRSGPAVLYHFGARSVLVAIDDEERRALRQALDTVDAAQR
jgi:hypothetical protein